MSLLCYCLKLTYGPPTPQRGNTLVLVVSTVSVYGFMWEWSYCICCFASNYTIFFLVFLGACFQFTPFYSINSNYREILVGHISFNLFWTYTLVYMVWFKAKQIRCLKWINRILCDYPYTMINLKKLKKAHDTSFPFFFFWKRTNWFSIIIF